MYDLVQHIHLDSITHNVHPDPFESGGSDPEPDFGNILTLEFLPCSWTAMV